MYWFLENTIENIVSILSAKEESTKLWLNFVVSMCVHMISKSLCKTYLNSNISISTKKLLKNYLSFDLFLLPEGQIKGLKVENSAFHPTHYYALRNYWRNWSLGKESFFCSQITFHESCVLTEYNYLDMMAPNHTHKKITWKLNKSFLNYHSLRFVPLRNSSRGLFD